MSMEFNSARSYARIEDNLEEAEKWALVALEKEPDNAQIPYFLAIEVYRPQKKYDRVGEMYKEALKRNSNLELEQPFKSGEKIIKTIHPDSFRPAPKVDSSVIRLVPRNSGLTHEEEKLFLKWSHLLFQQRRKTLLNGIRSHFPEWYQNCEDLLGEKFALRRPESLAFTEWLNLFEDYLQNKKMNPAKALRNNNKKIIN